MDLSRVSDHDPVPLCSAGRDAAVLVPVIDAAVGPKLVFTKRAAYLKEHPGQMSFPGGGVEPFDQDLTATALREAHEEIGLVRSEATVLGQLDCIQTVTQYAICPVVARVPDRTYQPDEREVAEIVPLSIGALTDPTNYESELRDHPAEGEIRLHYFRVNGYTVWGATARMLVQFLELVTDWTVPETPDRQVDPDADFPV